MAWRATRCKRRAGARVASRSECWTWRNLIIGAARGRASQDGAKQYRERQTQANMTGACKSSMRHGAEARV